MASVAPVIGTDFSQAEQILQSGTLGGVRGLRVRQVGAPSPAFSKQGGYVFYPASTIKVLEHLYAMTLIDQGTWDLFGTTPRICTGSTNCTSSPNGASCGVQEWWLFTVLNAMMIPSSNQATNAIQEEVGREFFPIQDDPALWGRFLMTGFAHANVGMPDTELVHKLGCGGPCTFEPANALTLIDIEELYQDIAVNGAVLSPPTRVTLHDTMLNEKNTFLNSTIDQEASATGRNEYRDAFKAKTFMIYKNGNQDCDGLDHRSGAGLLQLPTHGGTYKRLHTWGLFTENSQVEFYLPGTMNAAARELLRYPIRSALLTWGNFFRAAQTASLHAQMEALPSYQDSTPVGELLRDAARALLRAQDALDQEERNYESAVEDLQRVVVLCLQANETPSTLAGRAGEVPDPLIRDVVDLAEELVVDATSIAYMTSTSSALESTILAMENHRALGSGATATGDFNGAMDEFKAAATAGAPLVDWTSRGPEAEDVTSGFVGSAPWIFGDGFETGNVAAWSPP